jgi:hypothetical protein
MYAINEKIRVEMPACMTQMMKTVEIKWPKLSPFDACRPLYQGMVERTKDIVCAHFLLSQPHLKMQFRILMCAATTIITLDVLSFTRHVFV